ncbi:MAG: response regulator transcription factor [Flavobacteriales bacterium]|jgi:two-component system, OmpR family, response regulator VicR|nr:response regulator transcription factor [Flavobacteriales bacterium]
MSKAHILLVEDDPALGLVLLDLLKMEGFKVELLRNGSEALTVFSSGSFDLGLFDVMLPGLGGIDLTATIRKTAPQFPIILLTAKSRTEDRVRGLKAGADDYITKPFDSEELLLRLRGLLKRSRPQGSSPAGEANERLSLGLFSLDTRGLILFGPEGKGERQLTRKEGDLLRLLMQRAGQTTEREVIAQLIWGREGYLVGRSMDVYMTRLRKYLKADPSLLLRSVQGVGFRLEQVQHKA